MSHFIKKTNIYGLLVVILVVVCTVFIHGKSVLAVGLNENRKGVAQYVVDQVNEWNQTPPGYCVSGGRQFKHFQFNWLSQPDKQNDQVLTINEGTNEVSAWLNSLGGHCNAGVNTANGKVVDQTLRFTKSRLFDSTASINSAGAALSVSGLNDKAITLKYGESYYYTPNLRYVKRPAFSGDERYRDIPEFLRLKVSGLSTLNARTEPYTLKIAVKVRGINHFISTSGKSTYICIVDPDKKVSSIDDPSCPHVTVNAEIKIQVQTKDLACTITPLNGTSFSPGDRVRARVTATNQSATQAVPVGASGVFPRYRFATPVVDQWGSGTGRFEIPSTTTSPSSLLEPNKSSSVEKEFVIPSDSAGSETINIVILKALAAGDEENKYYASCNLDIQVGRNLPYLRISGGDVRVGAKFDHLPDPPCNYQDTNAENANINTNGFYESSSGEPDGDSLNGSSSGQYAVFASGLLDSVGGTNNNFSGNNVYTREGEKDLVFANTGLADSNHNGQYYSGSGSECVEVKDDIDSADLADNQSNQTLDYFISDAVGFRPETAGYSKVTKFTNSSYTTGGYQIEGQKVAVIEGDLTIDGNITYNTTPGAGYGSVGNIPNLKVIVLGNIYIRSNVTSLDGTYIALPTSISSKGILDTCSDIGGGAGVWADGSAGRKLTASSCEEKLTVNGSLIAKDILLKRTRGTLGKGNVAIDTACVYDPDNDDEDLSITQLQDCAAEYIRFSPEVYFNNVGGTPGGTTNVSNVPNSTVELPPIY